MGAGLNVSIIQIMKLSLRRNGLPEDKLLLRPEQDIKEEFFRL